MIDKALPFHLPVQDVLQLGRDPVATASSFTFGPHLVPVGRVRCLGTIVSIGSGAAASTPGAAGGGAAEAGAALQPGDDSISDGIAGNENEHTGSDVGGAVAVELDDGTGAVLVRLTAAIVRRHAPEVGKVVDIVGSVIDGAASPPPSSAAPAASLCARRVELAASHLWPVPWPAAKRQRSTDMAQLLKDCYANAEWCAARKNRRDIAEPDDAMQVFFAPVAATKARAPASTSTTPSRPPPHSKKQSSGSSSASLSASSSSSASTSSSWNPASSKSAARPLSFNASTTKRNTSKPTPQQVRQQHQQQEWRRLYQQRQRRQNEEGQLKQKQRERAQGHKRQRSQSPPNRLLLSSSSSSSSSLVSSSSSTHPVSRMQVPRAKSSPYHTGGASASTGNRTDLFKNGNSNGGQYGGQERSRDDTYDFYDIPSQETPSRDNKKGGVSQNFLRGDALSPRSTGSASNISTSKENGDRRKLNGDSSSSSSSSSSSRWSVGSSQGSQGPGLTTVSEPLLRVIEAAAKTASRGAHLDQLQASAPHLSPNDLVTVLQDLQMGGFIYMTGAGAYTAL